VKVDGVVLTDTFANAALLLFEVQAAFIDIGNQRNGLSKIDMHGLVVGQILVESIRVLDRAVLYARRAARAFVLDDVARLFGQRDCEIPRRPFHAGYFCIG
jgi:hypothetical protein